MTTPAEKDAMALAVLDRIGTAPISETERGQVAEARAHLAARVALLTDTQQRLSNAEAELASANAKLDASIATGNSLIAEREILYRKLGEAEAELAAVREWLAKLEAFVGPGALAYMRREFDAARGANK